MRSRILERIACDPRGESRGIYTLQNKLCRMCRPMLLYNSLEVFLFFISFHHFISFFSPLHPNQNHILQFCFSLAFPLSLPFLFFVPFFILSTARTRIPGAKHFQRNSIGLKSEYKNFSFVSLYNDCYHH